MNINNNNQVNFKGTLVNASSRKLSETFLKEAQALISKSGTDKDIVVLATATSHGRPSVSVHLNGSAEPFSTIFPLRGTKRNLEGTYLGLLDSAVRDLAHRCKSRGKHVEQG